MIKFAVTFFGCLICLLVQGQDTFRLAQPLLQYPSVFFKKTMQVTMQFAQPGTTIYYTLNGTEPTMNDAVYQSPVTITKNKTTVKAKVFGSGFLPSATVNATFIKDGLPIISTTQTTPNPKYAGNGTAVLFDNLGGIPNVNSGYWLGYQTDTVSITLYLQRRQAISSVVLSLLSDHGAWVFLPQKVSMYYMDEASGKFVFCYSMAIPTPAPANGGSVNNFSISLNNKIKAGVLKVVMEPLQSIPEKHPGHGTRGWLFIDEIKVY